MNAIHWFEAKQLDRVTNYSSRTECIKNVLDLLYYDTKKMLFMLIKKLKYTIRKRSINNI